MNPYQKKIKTNFCFLINGLSLTSDKLVRLSSNQNTVLKISNNTCSKIEKSNKYLNELVDENRIIYGVNTGMGGFVRWLIPPGNERLLQENLIRDVATNVGQYLDDEIARGSILARLNSLARGCSGISLKNFNILVEIFNKGIIPCIPSKGSLGASGDLGPLAAIALVATGQWLAKYKNKIMSGREALDMAQIETMKLGYKEGLALINGTSVMTALAAFNVEAATRLINLYEGISALSFEALNVHTKCFDPIVHEQKPHLGQRECAQNLWNFLKSSKMVNHGDEVELRLKKQFDKNPNKINEAIEDAYSIRCTPQILGPIKDTITWVRNIVNNELNSSNDNPLIIPKENDVFHNGHFHGQYIAMAMDYLTISMTTLSNLSDRRIDRFMDQNNSNGLSPFLVGDIQGLSLGLMGTQFMSTSLTAENRSLCTPLSIQTLTSTGDFQDIVSMGLIAARRCQAVINNLYYIIGVEFLCGKVAVKERGYSKLSASSKKLIKFMDMKCVDIDAKLFTDRLESITKVFRNC